MILDVGEAGVAAKFQGQTLRVAGYSVRRQVAPDNVGEVEWNPGRGGMDVL